MAKTYQIIARKWFSKLYGNTYHTVEIYQNNIYIAKSPITYGYGRHYEYTAFGLLQQKGKYPKTKTYSDFTRDIRNNKFIFIEVNVYRRKDL